MPKLFFGNNFDELRLKDFGQLANKLIDILEQMGVEIALAVLLKANVCAVHYSKNILLTDGSTPYHYINKIKQANTKLSLDVNQTDYKNEGHSYKWHCNSYEVVFYDKIKDLEKAKLSSKRAIEKHSELQLNIFDKLKNRKKLEILRMEVRLNNRKKIKQLFSKLNIKSNLTFKSIFKPAISKKVLLHYLDEIESKRPFLFDYKAKSDLALLGDLIFNNPKLGPKQILQMFGLKKVFENINSRELRNLFEKYSKRSWYRLIADANKVQLSKFQTSLKSIKDIILSFKALGLIKE